MVDEFQDTNPRQLAILRALERREPVTVGDALQSIYGFRHADVSLFRARHDELAEHGGSLSLTRNFRGRKPLLDVVNAVFEERLGDGFTPLRAGRVEETAPEEPVVELLLTNNAAGTTMRSAPRGSPASFLPRHAGARPKRGSWLSVSRSWWRAAPRRPGTWRCCCARSATWRCTSERCRTAV